MRLAGRGQRGQLVLAPAQDGLDDAVHQQVGVAPDGAGEVRVGLEGQAEVAAVDGGVDGLAHRAQQHHVDLLGVGALLGGLGDALELVRAGLIAHAQAHAQRLQVGAQQLHLLGRGPLVHAVQAHVLAQADEVGAAHVGRQHALFDQAVRVVARARHDLLDVAGLVAHDLRLDGVEVDRAAPLPRAQQGAVHLVQVQQVGHARAPLRGLGPARVGQDGRHLGVGQARVAVHHRRVQLVGMHLALRGDQHVAHHAQALHLGVERAQAVAELLGQHGDHAARKVHAGGAVVGVDVDRAARRHVVAHVGNGHQQTPAVGLLAAARDHRRLGIHRVVEVARVLAVDGDQGHVGQIDPAGAVLGTHRVGQGARLGHAGVGKLVRHAVLAHRDLDLHARVVHLAQHLLHAADGLAVQRRRLGQLDDDHLPGPGGADGALGNHHVLAEALVLGRHQPQAAFVQQAADDGLRRALDDLEHAPLGAAAPVQAHHAHAHAVAVQHRPHLVGRQVDVRLTVVAQHETVAVAMPGNDTFDFVRNIFLGG